MPLLHRFAAVSACALFLSAQAVPQQTQAPAAAQPAKTPAPAANQGTVFTSTSTEVIVPVTVTDDRGKFVTDLQAKDFRILDEGKPQHIEFFSHAERQPIVVGFLLDVSNANKIHWKRFQEAAKDLVWNLLPGDKRYSGYLITYSNEAEVAVNTTSDAEKITAKIDTLKPGGGAALYDAIYKACTTRTLVKGEPYEPRRIIIVIGDGHNSAGSKTLEQVIELSQRNLVTIYGMSTMAFGFANEDKDTLEKLANDTGGHVEYPLNTNLYSKTSGYLSNPQDAGNYALTVGTGAYDAEILRGITDAVAGVSGEITTQYVLRYIPDLDPEGKTKAFRRIKVDIPGLPNVKLHHRPGYWPNGVPGAAPASGQ
jgi:Ca-activated chloride channel family protein